MLGFEFAGLQFHHDVTVGFFSRPVPPDRLGAAERHSKERVQELVSCIGIGRTGQCKPRTAYEGHSWTPRDLSMFQTDGVAALHFHGKRNAQVQAIRECFGIRGPRGSCLEVAAGALIEIGRG